MEQQFRILYTRIRPYRYIKLTAYNWVLASRMNATIFNEKDLNTFINGLIPLHKNHIFIVNSIIEDVLED